jgi:hypothetical protein
MHLVGSKNQVEPDVLYDASGVIASGGIQLVLPAHRSRSHLFFQNNGTHAMFLEVGSARATATISGGAIASIAVTNAGFNFTYAPIVRFAGGGNAGNSSFIGLNQPGGEGPNSALTQAAPAAAHCVMASSGVVGNKVNTIVVDQGGAGFVVAPYVFIMNSQLDPYGCALPASGTGIQIGSGGGSAYYNGTTCFTDSVSVFGTAGDAFCCKWMV